MAAKKDGGEGGGKKSGGGLVALILLTLIAGGAGAAHGLQIFKVVHVPGAAEAGGAAAPDAHAADASKDASKAKAPAAAPPVPGEPVKLPSKMVLKDLPHVLTNVAMPPDSWIRLEASIVYDQAEVANPDVLVGEISNDLLAYLRSLSLREIQGAEGFMYLRQDMKDRVSLRAEGKVRDLVIQTLVLQ